MDHDATREQLELAAAEPGGLERLMAGDTPAAQAVAAHLAGCSACADELARLDRAARVIGQVIREQPPADLRDRTLAAVRANGVQRGIASGPSAAPDLHDAAASGSSRGSGIGANRGRSVLGWVAAIAAITIVSVIATSTIVGARVDERLAAQATEIEALEHVTLATLDVTAQPDAERVALAGAGATGSLVYSPSTTQLVVVASGLTPPPAGQEYRCWVEQAGDREGVGKRFFSDGLAYWIGPVDAVQGLVDDATFGVTLVSLDGSTDNQDVMEGDL
jgi:hypothetical protein